MWRTESDYDNETHTCEPPYAFQAEIYQLGAYRTQSHL